jgi:DUF1680 family protein
MKLSCSLLASSLVVVPTLSQSGDYPIQPVPFTAVAVNDSFWSPRFETNRIVTVGYDFQKCEETGRIDNFAKAGKLMPGEFKGTPFDDSDVFKVIEGAAYVLAMQPDPKLDKYLDELIAKIAAAQEPDGYLYTARTIDPQCRVKFFGPERWSNLAVSHELYNVGHLYEAAVAHFQATGKKSLLNVATKNADLLCDTFGPGKLQEPPGHQEIEIGLVKLFRVTGDEKYLRLAQFFVDIRGRADTHKLRGPYQQDHAPLPEQTEAVGHAVRAGYFYSGVADVAALTGNAEYTRAIDRLWEDVVYRKLHLTGGIGASRAGEAFGAAYDLPNRTAYLETCAAIANAFWNHRMFLLHGDAKYVDVLERVIYNGFLSGVSLSGDRFFYPNPLETDGKTKFNQGTNERAPWFGCSCCPVNVVRFIPSIAGYIYATRGDELFVNLFIGGNATVKLGPRTVKLNQQTRYPWDGAVKLTVTPDTSGEFTLNLRIPGWVLGRPVPGELYRYADAGSPGDPVVTELHIKINGREFSGGPVVNGFLILKRNWKPNDVVEIQMPMPVRRVLAHDAVKANTGRVAIERGPVVYCAEGADNDGQVLNRVLPDGAVLTPEYRPDLFGGVMILRGPVTAVERGPDGSVVPKPADLTLIPYYAWNHRGANEMAVWLPRTPEVAQLPSPPAPARYKASASHCSEHDTVDALSDGLEPENSNDHSIPRFTWWPRKGGTEWVQYDFDAARKVSGVAVYWFDDTGAGSCRVPQSARLLYKSGNDWKPVSGAAEIGVKKDAWNSVSFPTVEATALRLEVKLQPEFSGGILEWRIAY